MSRLIGALVLSAVLATTPSGAALEVPKPPKGPDLPRPASNKRQERLASKGGRRSKPGRNLQSRGEGPPSQKTLLSKVDGAQRTDAFLKRWKKEQRRALNLSRSQAKMPQAEPGRALTWRDITIGQALVFVKQLPWTAPDGTVVEGPLTSNDERCPFPWEPATLRGAPLGMYHCSACGEMVIAGADHTDWTEETYTGLAVQLVDHFESDNSVRRLP